MSDVKRRVANIEKSLGGAGECHCHTNGLLGTGSMVINDEDMPDWAQRLPAMNRTCALCGKERLVVIIEHVSTWPPAP